jgi:hypothetical protein
MLQYRAPNNNYLKYASLFYDTCEFHILAPHGATLTSFFIHETYEAKYNSHYLAQNTHFYYSSSLSNNP